jgi:hypothetical protein
MISILWLSSVALAVVVGLFLIYIYFNDLFLLATKNKALRCTLGTLLVIIGIAGIFVPIVPGWLLIFVGLALLRVLFLKRIVKRLAKKMGVKVEHHHLLKD